MVLTGMSVIGAIADEKGSKVDIKLLMSVFPLIMSVIGGNADINSRAADVRS